MRRISASVLGFLVCGIGFAMCPAGHFSQAHEAARVALEIKAAPRMAYIPRNVLEGENSTRSLQFLCERVADAMQSHATKTDDFAIASVDDTAQMWLLNCIGKANKGVELPLLRFAFVGDPKNEAAARAVVEKWGSQFYFVSDRALEQGALEKCNVPEGKTPDSNTSKGD